MTDALEGGRDADLRLQTQALKLAGVGVPNIVAGEGDCDAARKNEIRGVAVGAGAWAADRHGMIGRFEQEGGLFGFGLGALVHQHYGFALIPGQGAWINRLDLEIIGVRRGDAVTRQVRAEQQRAIEHRGRFLGTSEVSRDRRASRLGYASQIKDDGLGGVELREY